MTRDNIYTRRFVLRCPVNGRLIRYTLRITTEALVPVEVIVTVTEKLDSDYHENIADNLYVRFGGRQVLTAHHHGVDIETVRGE